MSERFEIGQGPCPCGKGIITVEACYADHSWAFGELSRKPALLCEVCGPKYAFFQGTMTNTIRLVLRDDLETHEAARQKWHQKLRDIEASAAYKDLLKTLDLGLAREKSAAARYRLLSAGGLIDMSIGQFRRNGYKLSVQHVSKALRFLGVDAPELAQMVEEADQFAKQMHREVPGIKTGIRGLEM